MLDLREIPDTEVVGLHRAADAGVLAYRDVFSSGALLLALSCGFPVVVPDEGTAREIAGDDACERFAQGGLAAAMERMRAADAEARSAHAAAVARRYGSARIGAETAALYRAISAIDEQCAQLSAAASSSWLSKTALHSDSE